MLETGEKMSEMREEVLKEEDLRTPHMLSSNRIE